MRPITTALERIGLAKGCAGFSPGSANRCDQFTRHPGRTSSPLRPDLDFRYTQGSLSADLKAPAWRPDTEAKAHCSCYYWQPLKGTHDSQTPPRHLISRGSFSAGMVIDDDGPENCGRFVA